MDLLIADSGSTKCDWVYHSSKEQLHFSTIGLNPLLLTSEEIVDILEKSEELSSLKDQSVQLFFYGAACSNDTLKEVIHHSLSKVLPLAQIKVEHDLLGAIHASCGNDAGFTAILGTGSNLCYFTGKTIIQNTPSLGYILGDEGSGAYLGKLLLQEYYYQTLPPELSKQLEKEFNVQVPEVIKRIYSEARPNAYLASYAPFLVHHKNHPYIYNMVYMAFARFLSRHLWSYDNFRDHPVHFIGSIAYYFQDILQEVAINHRFTVGKIIQKPLDNLLEFHQQNS